MMPIEPEPPAEPSAESGELEGLAPRTVLLSEEQTPDHGGMGIILDVASVLSSVS